MAVLLKIEEMEHLAVQHMMEGAILPQVAVEWGQRLRWLWLVYVGVSIGARRLGRRRSFTGGTLKRQEMDTS
jgi:hypothetical protein